MGGGGVEWDSTKVVLISSLTFHIGGVPHLICSISHRDSGRDPGAGNGSSYGIYRYLGTEEGKSTIL